LNYVNIPFGGELRFTAALNNQARTWFWVVKSNTQQGSSGVLQLLYPVANTTGGDQIYIYRLNLTNAYYLYEQPYNTVKLAADSVPNPYNASSIYSIVNSTTASNNNVSVNGTGYSLSTSAIASGYATSNITYGINMASVTNYQASLDVFEILFFQRNLTLSERQQVEGYLAWKWGIQNNLPNTHPYYSAKP
jgi:hypothetical protein